MRFLALAMSFTAAPLLLAGAAFAHTGHPEHGFLAGLLHPLQGLDHILAMVAVGAWAAQQGGRAVVVLPAAFVAIMALGGALGMAGIGLPAREPMIVASVAILGALIALAARPPLAVGAALIGAFALFHGLAHGAALPSGAGIFGYAAGFVAATAVLHAAGIAFALNLRRVAPPAILRALGACQTAAAIGLGVALVAV